MPSASCSLSDAPKENSFSDWREPFPSAAGKGTSSPRPFVAPTCIPGYAARLVRPDNAGNLSVPRRDGRRSRPFATHRIQPPQAKRRLSPAEWNQVINRVPAVAGIKVAGGDGNWYSQMKPVMDRISVFIPGHLLAEGLRLGASGSYSNVACLSPLGSQRYYDACVHRGIYVTPPTTNCSGSRWQRTIPKPCWSWNVGLAAKQRAAHTLRHYDGREASFVRDARRASRWKSDEVYGGA
jgi:hypothetical protein